MNPRERYLRCVRGERVDCVPLFLEGLSYSSREELAQEPDALKRDVAERLFDYMHYWHLARGAGNRYLMTPGHRIRTVHTEERGGNIITTREIDTPKGPLSSVVGQNKQSRTTWHIKHPVQSLEDIAKIRSVPWERPEHLAPPDPREVPAGFAGRGIWRGGVSSPMVCVAGMMPREYFLELCLLEPALIGDLTEICLERILDVLGVVLSNRVVEYVWMGGSEWLTPPMGSPAMYEAFVQKQEERIIRRVHEAGAVCHVHCHGNVRAILERVVERGADFFEPVEPPPDGDITFAEAKAQVGGRMTLGGNIEARVLEKGSADEVEQAVRAAYEGPADRWVLRNSAGPICAFDERMHRNYHRLIDVWEALSGAGAQADAALASATA
ncbi:MAG: hypothetical protein JXR37_20170 [Kiritimatiellae bacterium]|nr:hypothetical protein [Kiritimatiellia bacterium]